jgi:hypothetical protein
MVKVTSAENRILRYGIGLDDNEIVVPRDNKVFLCNVKSIYSLLITLYVRKAYHSLGIKDELQKTDVIFWRRPENQLIFRLSVAVPARLARHLRLEPSSHFLKG